MPVRRLVPVMFVAFALGTSACDTHDDFETYVATLDGAQENPGTGSSASGRAVLLLSRNGDRADITVTVDGTFSGDLVQAHIHRAPRGVNGSVIFWLWARPGLRAGLPTDPPFGVGNPLGKTWTPSTADPQGLTPENLSDLRAGNLYVNVHSTRFAGGEIRGQLMRQ